MLNKITANDIEWYLEDYVICLCDDYTAFVKGHIYKVKSSCKVSNRYPFVMSVMDFNGHSYIVYSSDFKIVNP